MGNRHVTNSPEQTFELGSRLGESLQSGDVVALRERQGGIPGGEVGEDDRDLAVRDERGARIQALA